MKVHSCDRFWNFREHAVNFAKQIDDTSLKNRLLSVVDECYNARTMRRLTPSQYRDRKFFEDNRF